MQGQPQLQPGRLFDVVHIDAPAKETSQKNIGYPMMDDAEILALPIELVQKKGYCFYWTINSKDYLAEQFFAAHGYKKVDTIGWLKLSSKTGKESMSSPGCYFRHTMEFCHVGIKGDFKSVSAISKLRTHSNFICGPRREGSRSQQLSTS